MLLVDTNDVYLHSGQTIIFLIQEISKVWNCWTQFLFFTKLTDFKTILISKVYQTSSLLIFGLFFLLQRWSFFYVKMTIETHSFIVKNSNFSFLISGSCSCSTLFNIFFGFNSTNLTNDNLWLKTKRFQSPMSKRR